MQLTTEQLCRNLLMWVDWLLSENVSKAARAEVQRCVDRTRPLVETLPLSPEDQGNNGDTCVTTWCPGTSDGKHDFTYIRNREKRCKLCGEIRNVPDKRPAAVRANSPEHLAQKAARNISVPHAARPINIGPKYCAPDAHTKEPCYVQGVGDVEVCSTCGMKWQYPVQEAMYKLHQDYATGNAQHIRVWDEMLQGFLCNGNMQTREHTWAYWRNGMRGTPMRRCITCDVVQAQTRAKAEHWIQVFYYDGNTRGTHNTSVPDNMQPTPLRPQAYNIPSPWPDISK